MVHIFLRTRLTPPTLLPFLHDLYHHQTPRWFAELEAVYRAVDNLDDLLDEALHQEVTLDKLKSAHRAAQKGMSSRARRRCCGLGLVRSLYWRFRWSRLQEDLSIEQWRRNGYLLNWYLLVLVRDKYLSRQLDRPHSLAVESNTTLALSKREQAAALGDLPPLPVALTELERAHFASLGITVPATSSELPPPYPETRPLALRTCPLLRLVDARAANHREEQLRTTWEGPVDEEIRVRWAEEGEGVGKSDDWLCPGA